MLRPIHAILQEFKPPAVHGNQVVLPHHVLAAHLLAFFNPIVRSLRMIEDLARTPLGRQFIGLDKLPKSTLSEAQHLIDPDLLHRLTLALLEKLPKGVGLTDDLHEIKRQVIAVDGTYFNALAGLACGVVRRHNDGRLRNAVGASIHLDCNTRMPTHFALIDGDKSEAELAAGRVDPGVIYLYDRAYINFDLVRKIIDSQAFFVLRLTTQTVFAATREMPLNPADLAVGVISDRVGRLDGRDAPAELEMREVFIEDADEPTKPVRLLTNVLDLTAAQIGLLYRARWQVEIFFRWLKVYANFHHVTSHSREGVLLNFYVAVIGTLLVCLKQNRAPNKYDVSMLCLIASGGGTYEEIGPIMAERARQCEVARLSQRKRNQKKRLMKKQA